MERKVVVTGGAGFIGSWIIDYLLKDKNADVSQIVIIDNLLRGTKDNIKHILGDKRIVFVKGDIRDISLVNKHIKGADWVVHMAVIKNRNCDDDPRLCNEILVDGTFNIFDACVKYKVKKIVFNSSASVYGDPLKLPMKENDPYRNDAMYGAAKVANEQFAKAFHRQFGLNYVCFRPFNVYGPRMDASGIYTEVLIKWLERINSDQSPVIFGDGKQTFDFIYVEDVARLVVKALKSKITEGFYNLGSGKQVSLKALAQALLEATNSKLKIEYKTGNGQIGYVSRRQADLKLVNKTFGFKPQVDLQQGMQKLVKWYNVRK